jgi:hypothetical protein
MRGTRRRYCWRKSSTQVIVGILGLSRALWAV